MKSATGKSNCGKAVESLLTVLLVGALVGGCERHEDFGNQSPQANGWRKVELPFLSLRLPPSMRERRVPAVDLSIWEFADDSMVLEVHYGQTVSSGQEYRQQPGFVEHKISIDGFQALGSQFRLDGSVPTNYSDNGFNYIASLFFPDVGRFGNRVLLLANCKNEKCIDDARKIFSTITVPTGRQ